jgi:hypothetical protein
MTLGNMRELSLQTEFEKGNDHHGKFNSIAASSRNNPEIMQSPIRKLTPIEQSNLRSIPITGDIIRIACHRHDCRLSVMKLANPVDF